MSERLIFGTETAEDDDLLFACPVDGGLPAGKRIITGRTPFELDQRSC